MTSMLSAFPESAAERDAWVLEQRSLQYRDLTRQDLAIRGALDPQRPWAYQMEEERAADGAVVPVATLFLTSRECPWRCTMCDLWRNTLAEATPPGAVPAQIAWALGQLPNTARHIKLYNSGSFFDPRAIPPADHAGIARLVRGFERVVVENHPALTGKACLPFRDQLPGTLEIAMGLETAHPEVLEKLNKRITVKSFRAAAEFLRRNSIALRVFILVQPPFMRADESLDWAERSLQLALECGAASATLIPTRAGNGAMEALAQQGQFTPPPLAVLESAVECGLALARGTLFQVRADTWDLPRPFDCPQCGAARAARLRTINLTRTATPRIACDLCGGRS